MDLILISIIILAIIIFYSIGHFVKKYKHHHGSHKEFKEYMETPVFTELTPTDSKEENKKHSKHVALSHEKIKKLVRKGK